jgi:Indole-3-glycerol phosphate synthase
MTGILATICAERAADVRRNKIERPPSSLERRVGPPRPAFPSARGALLIAECKRASPSRGLIVAQGYDVARLAAAYERGGAGMVSVLTESRRFLGSDADLATASEATALPVLRKDFIVDPYQVLESWAIGADAILLIAAALGEVQLLELRAAAAELGLAVLLELRDEKELQLAADARPEAVGVNARDLSDFSVDLGRSIGLARRLPAGSLPIAESGIRSPEDAATLISAGYRGLLIGEALASSADPEAATRGFVASLKERTIA